MIRLRVGRAVERQKRRSTQDAFVFNGQLNQRQLNRYCQVDEASRMLLARAIAHLGLSARAYDRVLRIARTIADLCDRDSIQPDDIAEAIRYRTMCRAS